MPRIVYSYGLITHHEMEEDEISEGLKDWEEIQSSSSAQAQAEAQTHSRPWETVVRRNSLYDYSSVFPPSDHEGLPISSQDDLPQEEPEPESEPSSPSPSADSRLQVVGDIAKWFSFGFQVLCSKFIHISSSVRSYSASRGKVWISAPTTGVVAAAMLLSMFYMMLRQSRRRSRQEKNDRLILLIKEKDEKINQLLHQISQMNEVLSARCRVPVLRSG
ncbi:hypothetical protein HHK36_024694 [Tetracentron sinense]|uniref:Transmembrane protein n=1 Tax=Tetracentron sinense TaxID=13715 RepID=A0A834YQH7_TETSI|nr:hypothetical protein HHK36_024694 [Tetracentron sinense]